MAQPLSKYFDHAGRPREPHTLWERVSAPFRLPTLTSGTSDEWEEWTANAKRDHPILYWLDWTFSIQLSRWRRQFITDPYWWVRYRTTNRNHMFRVRSVKPGWCDRNVLMLHSNFQLLVDFVELEMAAINYEWFESNGVKHRSWRRYPEAGVDQLRRQMEDPHCQQGPAGQTTADISAEKLELYQWWTQQRPTRMEPWSDQAIWGDRDVDMLTDLSNSPRGLHRQECGRQAMALDEIHEAEDQHMLMRLIAVRRSLWT